MSEKASWIALEAKAEAFSENFSTSSVLLRYYILDLLKEAKEARVLLERLIARGGTCLLDDEGSCFKSTTGFTTVSAHTREPETYLGWRRRHE